MNGLELFAGAGIPGLALKHTIPNYRTVGYVEWDEYCCKVIEQRIKDGILDDAPIWQVDIREFNERIAPGYAEKVDLISGGFPCQPFSVAGKRRGADDDRDMWPATRDTLRIVQPTYAFLENVPALLASGYFGRITGDLAEIGYDLRWGVVGAADVGAPHLRKRIWILADSQSVAEWSRLRQGEPAELGRGRSGDGSSQVADTVFCGRGEVRTGRPLREDQQCRASAPIDPLSLSNGLQGEQEAGAAPEPTDRPSEGSNPGWWSVEPDVGRVANGIPHRVDRLKAIGNGWVPQVVKSILTTGAPR